MVLFGHASHEGSHLKALPPKRAGPINTLDDLLNVQSPAPTYTLHLGMNHVGKITASTAPAAKPVQKTNNIHVFDKRPTLSHVC